MKLSFNAFILIFIFSLTAFAQSPNPAREAGIALYKQGDYKAAIKTLKDFTKENSADYLAFHYLAMAFMRENKLKDAEKAFEKAIKNNPNFADSQVGLSYIYLRRNKLDEAIKTARTAVSLDDKNIESYYILGTAQLRSGEPEKAFGNAERIIGLNPNFANAHLLKAHSILNILLHRKDYKAVYAQYGSPVQSISRYITLAKDLPNINFWRGQQEALKFFADYYAEREKLQAAAGNEQQRGVKTPLKIISKVGADYTGSARSAGVNGVIRLLVAFSENGTIGHIFALNSLGYGLDESAFSAAKKIKFEPETIDGKPVTAVKLVEYHFTLY
jgi:TonB family protein